jgi:hypothetical protein
LAEAFNEAYRLVREPRVANAIEALAGELVARAGKGFGMGSEAIGRVIARANDEFDARHRRLGQRAPRPTLKGCTPSEEIARPNALLAEINAGESVSPIKRQRGATSARLAPRPPAKMSGYQQMRAIGVTERDMRFLLGLAGFER